VELRSRIKAIEFRLDQLDKILANVEEDFNEEQGAAEDR